MKLWLTVTAAIFAMALLFAALANGNYAAAQTPDTPTPVPTTEQPGNFSAEDLAAALASKKKGQPYPNMDSNLNRILQQIETGRFTAQAAAASVPIHREESVAVTLYITEAYADAIAAWLTDNGADPRNIGVDYIEAYVQVSLLAEASQQEGVISVRTIIPGQPAQGTVVSEGAAAHGAPAWHAAGIKGQGVKIGIIDTGFQGFISLMGTELPTTVQARCYTDIGVYNSNLSRCDNSNESKHGTAVTETAFDIAPESTYYISNPISFGDLQTAVQWMVTQHVDVINYSVGDFWDGPGDGTSPFGDSPLRNVDTAVASGITWVNVAGNEAESTWFGSSSREPFDSRYSFRFQRWSGSDITNCVLLAEGENFIAQLRWDDAWGGARRDLDLSLFDSEIEIVSSSDRLQNGGASHIPFEILSYTPSTSGIYCLTVAHYNSNPSAPTWIQLQAHSGQILEHSTSHHSIGNPAESANPGMLAVGATHYWDTRTIADYSSQGPTPDGRVKPDIVGVACGEVVSYDLRPPEFYDGNNCWFPGTSQASPHVAGLAALVKQNNPGYTPRQIAQYLKTHAEERGALGADNVWGYGFAMLPASEAPQATPTATPSPTPESTMTSTPEPTMTPTSAAQTPEPTTLPTATPTSAPGQPTATPTPEPTATPSPAPTAAPAPTVPAEVLNRLSALETLVATLQGLISTLEGSISALNSNVSALAGRVAALEADAANPAPTSTPVPVTPTATPVSVAPTPTPASGQPPASTPTPAPTATPVTDACLTGIASDGAANGSWSGACTTDRILATANAPVGTRYAGYFTFALSQQSEVTIALESSEDTYLFLLYGHGRNGGVTEQNDDIDSDAQNYNSRVVATLAAGEYTILATTYNLATAGNFTLTVSGMQ